MIHTCSEGERTNEHRPLSNIGGNQGRKSLINNTYYAVTYKVLNLSVSLFDHLVASLGLTVSDTQTETIMSDPVMSLRDIQNVYGRMHKMFNCCDKS